MRIGITGHQRLRDPANWHWVRQEINRILTQSPQPLVGLTSLAMGADQLFAELVLQLGGDVEAIIPMPGYELKFEDGHRRQEYNRFLQLASSVELVLECGSDEEAYFEAGKRVVDASDFVIAVWDGKPAAGFGGTGDAVAYAWQWRKTVIHLNPDDGTVTKYTGKG